MKNIHFKIIDFKIKKMHGFVNQEKMLIEEGV
jgi:hypothetical protein